MKKNLKAPRIKTKELEPTLKAAYQDARHSGKFEAFPFVYYSREELETLLSEKNCIGLKFYRGMIPIEGGKKRSNLVAVPVTEEPKAEPEFSARAAEAPQPEAGIGTPIASPMAFMGYQPCPDDCGDDQ